MSSDLAYDCRESFNRIDDFLDRELSQDEMILIGKHLEACAMCAQEFQFEAEIIRCTREKLMHLSIPVDLKSKISAALSSAVKAHEN